MMVARVAHHHDHHRHNNHNSSSSNNDNHHNNHSHHHVLTAVSARLSCRSRLGCQVIVTPDLSGMRVRLSLPLAQRCRP
jgi:hypothetical protein